MKKDIYVLPCALYDDTNIPVLPNKTIDVYVVKLWLLDAYYFRILNWKFDRNLFRRAFVLKKHTILIWIYDFRSASKHADIIAFTFSPSGSTPVSFPEDRPIFQPGTFESGIYILREHGAAGVRPLARHSFSVFRPVTVFFSNSRFRPYKRTAKVAPLFLFYFIAVYDLLSFGFFPPTRRPTPPPVRVMKLLKLFT